MKPQPHTLAVGDRVALPVDSMGKRCTKPVYGTVLRLTGLYALAQNGRNEDWFMVTTLRFKPEEPA
jgi:predicted oxidoreductase